VPRGVRAAHLLPHPNLAGLVVRSNITRCYSAVYENACAKPEFLPPAQGKVAVTAHGGKPDFTIGYSHVDLALSKGARWLFNAASLHTADCHDERLAKGSIDVSRLGVICEPIAVSSAETSLRGCTKTCCFQTSLEACLKIAVDYLPRYIVRNGADVSSDSRSRDSGCWINHLGIHLDLGLQIFKACQIIRHF
jgi:hypothetical protein